MKLRVFLCSVADGAERWRLDAVFGPAPGYPGAGWLSGKQFGNADQVVGDQIEQEVGGDPSNATMFGLAHGAMLLAPSEDALDHRPA